MDETTPRPLPPQLLGAYRNPTDLRGLLEAIFSPEQQAEVRDELLRRVLGRHGNVWIPVGDPTKDRTQRLTQRVRSFRSSPVKGIEFLLGLEDIGGRAKDSEEAGHSEVMLLLAEIMQPHWIEWWSETQDARALVLTGGLVLGSSQLRWLAAQFARRVFGYTSPALRPELLEVIATAEEYALGRVTYDALGKADTAVILRAIDRGIRYNEADRSAYGSAASESSGAIAADRSAGWAAASLDERGVANRAGSLAILANLARRLFSGTPELFVAG